jgi:hypothetical protein
MQKESFFYALIFATAVLCGVSCKKYEVKQEGAWTDAQAAVGAGTPRSIIYLDAGGLWGCTRYGKSKKLLVSSTSGIGKISISPDYSKIAYKKDNMITIIDSTGQVIKANIPATSIYYINWHHDNKMLYGIDYSTNKLVSVYGPALPAGLPQMLIQSQFDNFNFAYITKENDLFYANNSNASYYLAYGKNGSNGNHQYLYNYTNGLLAADEFHIANNGIDAVVIRNGGNRPRVEIKIQNRGFTKEIYSSDDILLRYPDGDYLESRINGYGVAVISTRSACKSVCYLTGSGVFDAK